WRLLLRLLPGFLLLRDLDPDLGDALLEHALQLHLAARDEGELARRLDGGVPLVGARLGAPVVAVGVLARDLAGPAVPDDVAALEVVDARLVDAAADLELA